MTNKPSAGIVVGVRHFCGRSVSFVYDMFVKPRAKSEDDIRREFILNVILLGIIALVLVCFFLVVYQSFVLGSLYKGISIYCAFLVLFIFSSLLILSRIGSFRWASFSFVGVFFFFATHSIYTWGVGLPEGLLAYTLIVVIAGILIGTNFAFLIALFLSITLIILTYFQNSGITHPKLYWQTEPALLCDAAKVGLFLLITAVASWLSNREIERTLKRARKSEMELKKEKSILEQRVHDRTKELEDAQREKMCQMARFIDFGEISSGLFHDLVNHLNFLFLHIEQAGEKDMTMAQTKKRLQQVTEAKKILVEYVEVARKQFQDQKKNSLFSVKNEIQCVIKILNYRLVTEKVGLNFRADFDVVTYGSAVRFNHVVANIILNSLDAYRVVQVKDAKRKVNIKLRKNGKKVLVSIEDWAGGIPERIQDRVFESFFTTKGLKKGTGIGLSTVKDIIEKDFDGTIGFRSVQGQGTKFIIEFPIKDEPRQHS